MKRLGIFLSILLLNACAIRIGLQEYVRSEAYTSGPLQVVLDCTISTIYEDSGAQQTGFSEDYNNEVCEAFADEVRVFAKYEQIGEVLEPVIITLGGQYGRDISTSKIYLDERGGRLDGEIKLPKSQGKTVPFKTLPQSDLSYLIKELSESKAHREALSSIKKGTTVFGPSFYDQVKALPVATNFPLVADNPILLISINGQKITDSLQLKSNIKSTAQGVGSLIASGLLTGGTLGLVRYEKMGSAVAVHAVLIDEASEIVWSKTSGGRLWDNLSETAKGIFDRIE